VCKEVEQINDYVFIDTYKSNKLKLTSLIILMLPRCYYVLTITLIEIISNRVCRFLCFGLLCS